MSRLSQTDKARVWLGRNRGVLIQLARELGYGKSTITDVLYGRRASRARDVERRLAELGCPGFDEYLPQASTTER
jgi:hypothetical protein